MDQDEQAPTAAPDPGARVAVSPGRPVVTTVDGVVPRDERNAHLPPVASGPAGAPPATENQE